MYTAWLLFEDRCKDVFFPELDNWNYPITLSQYETGWDVDLRFQARALNDHLYFSMDKAFVNPGKGFVREKELFPETLYHFVGRNERKLSLVIRKQEKSFLVFRKYLLPQKNFSVGRSENSDIYENNTLLSSMHGFFSFRNGIEYTDQSTNGTYLNGRKIQHNTVKLFYGDILTFPNGLKIIVLDAKRIAINHSGPNQRVRLEPCPPMEIVAVENENAEFEGNVYSQYHRSPRMLIPRLDEEVEVEPPIAKQEDQSPPWWLQLGPSMTMILPMAMGNIMGSLIDGRSVMISGLFMIGTSATLSVTWGVINRRYRQKNAVLKENRRLVLYQQYIQEIEQVLSERNAYEYRRLTDAFPNVADCALLPGDNTHRLWNRMPSHPDFLDVRLGIGQVKLPSEIKIQKQKLSIIDDPLRDEAQRLQKVYSVVADAPVTVSLRREPIVSILGGTEAILFAQGLLMQIAALHSYHDVRIAVLVDEASASQWTWARWLPHVFANEDRDLRMVATRKSAVHGIMNYLESVLNLRKSLLDDRQSSGDSGEEIDENATPLPHYIIFCSDYTMLEDEPVMRRLLNNRLGMTLVMIATSMEMLPKESRLIFNVGSRPGSLYTSSGETREVEYEYPNRNLLSTFSRSIAPLRVRDSAENAAIPTLVSFLDIYGVRRVEELDIWRMWNENKTYEGLKSTIGYSAGSRPYVLDISDKKHGPHGLIAGTTGSGKSVMLETYILSLALNYSPHQVQFVLIDYKGGGMAKAFQRLPHVAGIIDNLQGERVIDRALASLNGEIRRRELIFEAYGVNNINDYTQYCMQNESSPILPHLVIISDEFAELKSEQPDFMREVVKASRVGRSLGIHLILATQKPSNSVSDEIWANSRFHLCLRVQTRSDSMEMLKRPDAAYIKGMGRCFIQIGNDEEFDQLQTSYSGLEYAPDEPRIEELPQLLDETGQPLRIPRAKKPNASNEKYTQKDAVLEQICKIAEEHGMLHSKQLWLPEMYSQIYFSDLPMFRDACVRENHYANTPLELSAVMGLADDVAHQCYIPYVMNISAMRNLMIVGLAGSGKTTAIQSMVYSLASRYDPEHLNIYIMSLTSQTLGALREFPHVGDVVFEEEYSESKRLINMLAEEEQRRNDLFSQAATDNIIKYNESQLKLGKPIVSSIVVFVDRFEQLKTMFGNDEGFTTKLHNLIRNGSGRGIHFVVTALGKNEVPGKLHPFFGGLALQLKDKSDYSDVIGKRLPFDMSPIASCAGRGIGLVNDTPFEVQLGLGCDCVYNDQTDGFCDLDSTGTYIIDTIMDKHESLTDLDRSNQIVAFGKSLAAAWKGKLPQRIPRIPEEPTFELLAEDPYYQEAIRTPYMLPIGYDVAEGVPASINLEKNYSWLVYGPKRCGRSNMLKFIARSFMLKEADVFVIGDYTWKKFAEETGVKLYTSADEIVEFFHMFVNNYCNVRKPLRTAALEKGVAEARKQAMEFKPCAVIIDDASRLNSELKSDEHVKLQPSIVGLFAQLSQQAEHYNFFIFMSSSSVQRTAMSADPLKSLAAQGRGIALGGKLNEFDPCSAGTGMNLQSRSAALKPGAGYYVFEGNSRHIITPLASEEE